MRFIVILFLLFTSIYTLAQQSDSQLAYTYYQAKEYDKAAEKFLKLYERTHSANFLDYYIICLINGKEYDKAEDTLKKLLKTDDSNKDFLIDLGYIYQQQGKTNKSEECYGKAIKKIIPQNTAIINLANKFKNIREYSWAIKTYQQGRILLKKPDAFLKELGDCYLMERDYEQMMPLFVRSLELNPGSINNITAQLSFARSNDIVNSIDPVIEKTLKSLCQKTDYLPVFDELAVWYNLQIRNYLLALQHAVLLNNKSENKLHIFLNIALDAINNKAFDQATIAYQKILGKGKENNPFYLPARKGILTCRYEQLRQSPAERSDYLQIAGNCEKYMQEFGYTPTNIDILSLLAELYAYRLQQPDSADRLLDKAIRIPRLNPNTLSQLKSQRADLLTFMDNPWEATILYTQLEKANPNNDIGYEAKLKKAMLAYYAGDLLWAKAQFDVLKGATSKLISNDAIQMSHFIHMNYEAEGDNRDLEKMGRTEYLLYKQQFQEVLPRLDSLIGHCSPGISDYATLQKARSLCACFQDEEAAKLLSELKDRSEQVYIKAEALFQLAGLKRKQKELQQAKELYRLLVTDYSGSVYSIEAAKLYRDLEAGEQTEVNNL